jgi:hypothetical protein
LVVDVDVDLGQGSTHNRRSSVTPVASESVFQTFIITVHESTKKSQVLLQPLALTTTTSPHPSSDTCHQIPSRRPRATSCRPQCYRDSRHPGSAIEDVRRRICGRGLSNGPAKRRASRRVRVCARSFRALYCLCPSRLLTWHQQL